MLQKRDNYAIQANDARLRFLTYDQAAMPAQKDDEFLYLRFCGFDYRICRADGHLFRRVEGSWLSADSHGEVLTIYDYLCDAKPGRSPAREAVSMAFLGGHVHSGLAAASGSLEKAIDLVLRGAKLIGANPDPIGVRVVEGWALSDSPLSEDQGPLDKLLEKFAMKMIAKKNKK